MFLELALFLAVSIATSSTIHSILLSSFDVIDLICRITSPSLLLTQSPTLRSSALYCLVAPVLISASPTVCMLIPVTVIE